MKKILIIFAAMLLCSFAYSQSPQFDQTIVIDQTFTEDTEIFPFNGGFFYGVGINGNIAFNSDSSLVRIILKDSISDMQYLIYETYTMIDTTLNFDIGQECEETCFLDGITPTSIVVKVIDATVYINELLWSSSPVDNIEDLQKQAKHNKILEKIDKMNVYIEKEGLLWIAGETPFTKMFYNRRKDFYGKELPLGGYEFYTSGIFSFKSPKDDPLNINYDYVDNFDWRKKHGADNPESFYWDGNNDVSGWMTEPACQFGCWINGFVDCTIMDEDECIAAGGVFKTTLLCWNFASVALIEDYTNLYLNQHINFDLAEQEIASCAFNNPTIGGGLPSDALNYFIWDGVVDEGCFPFTGEVTPCENICNNPDEKISIDLYDSQFITSENQVREKLMVDGPLVVTFMNSPWGVWAHAMLLVGWDVIDEYDPQIIGVPNTSAIDDFIGATYWIYKNSYGPNGPNGGYTLMTNYENKPPHHMYSIPENLTQPIISNLGNFGVDDIQYYDNDGDGYWNWGIGLKPPDCTQCSDEKDGDDNNPGLGPLNSDGTLTIVGTFMADFENNFCNWRQSDQDDCDWYRHKGASEQYPTTGPSTGVNGDDDMYLLMRGDKCYTSATCIIESPRIMLDSYCGINVTFYYHRNTYTWGNPDYSYLSMDISYDNGQTWENNYWKVGDMGDSWNFVSLEVPPLVNKIRFVEHSNEYTFYNDVALDKIEIAPITNSNDIIISDEEEWGNNKVICGNIIIEPNGKLTLLPESNIYFGANSKIIVKRFGQLIVNNAKLSSATDDLWQGIEVWGTSTQPQQFPYQGLVKVINGGTIENAVCAVRAVKMGDPVEGGGEVPNPSYSGGIVQMNNAVLQNNKTAVRFYEYTNDNSVSYFNNTDFIAENNSPDYLAYLSGIDGISFTGCTFKDLRNLNITQRVTGITARDAKFHVDEYCDMNGNCTPSLFQDLNYGINAMTHNPLKAATIKNSQFQANHRSVYLSTMNEAVVVFNQFTPYTGMTMNGEESYCLYLDYCTDYTVEENGFEHTGNDPGGIGLIINNSGSDNNEIYRNDFTNLEYATLAQNCNRGEYYDDGLQIKCNDYWDNYSDIAVTAEEETEYPGIARNQGAEGGTEMQAGNLFSLNNNGYDESDYSTFKEGPIYYFHHDPTSEPRVKPVYYTNKIIHLFDEGNYYYEEQSCPSNFSGGGGSGGEDREGLRGTIAVNNSKADSVGTLLSALVDGGNSDVLKQEVLQTMPPQAYDLYMSLMGKSPYLSDSVLIATVEKEDILPNVIIKDILVANPQSAKSPEIMDKVEQKTVPMSDEMIAEILLGKYIVAAKEKLEAQFSYYRQKRSTALKFLKQSFLNDTVDPAAYDSLITLLENENVLREKYQLAFAYMKKNDMTSAENLLNDIPALFSLNTYEQNNYNDFVQLFNIVSDIQNSGIPVDSISDEMKQTLQQLADNSGNIAGAIARNILIEAVDYEYDEPIILPEVGMKAGIIYDLPQVSKDYKPRYVSIYPNPAMNYIVVELNRTNLSGAVLTLYDSRGNIIKSASMPGKTQAYVFGLKEVKPGIYIIKVEMDGKTAGSKKFSIIK